jgi:hypothetical protein
MIRSGFLVTLLVAGCGTADPCDGLQGTCLSARIEGMPAQLDQLRVTVAGQPMPMLSPTSPAAFSLPVRLAVVLTTPAPNASITVEGLTLGNVVGSSGAQMVTLNPGGRSSFTFTLAPTGSGGDMAMPVGDGPPDLIPPPGVVSIEPSSFTFPDTPRQTKSSTLATLLFTNNTNHSVTTTNNSMPTGDGNAFNFDPSSTCPMTMGPTTFAAGMQCTLVISFTPDVSGPIQMGLDITFDDGESIPLSINGKGLPVWSKESPPGASTQFTAVWASGPTDWWAVGTDPTCPLWRSTGTGQWTQNCPMPFNALNLYSINGSSANDVWLGDGSGRAWHWDGMAFTSQTPGATNVNVVGIIDFGPKNAVLIEANGSIYCIGSSGTFGGCPFMQPPAFTATSLSGVNGEGGHLVAGGLAGTLLDHPPMAATFNGLGLPPGYTMINTQSVWVAGTMRGDIFAVGSNAGPSAGAILHYGMGLPGLPESPGNSMGALFGVAGRVIDPVQNMIEVYAVGAIGPQVLRTTGNGTWSQLPIPGGMGVTTRAVFVLPNGDAVAVGDAAQIVHLY